MKKIIYDYGEYKIIASDNNYRVENKNGDLLAIRSSMPGAENFIKKQNKKNNGVSNAKRSL